MDYQTRFDMVVDQIRKNGAPDVLEQLIYERKQEAEKLANAPRQMAEFVKQHEKLRPYFNLDVLEKTKRSPVESTSELYEKHVDDAFKAYSGGAVMLKRTPAESWVALQQAWTKELGAYGDAYKIEALRDKQKDVSLQVRESVQDIAALGHMTDLAAVRAALGLKRLPEHHVERLNDATRAYFMQSTASQVALASGDMKRAEEAEARTEEAMVVLRDHPMGYAHIGRSARDIMSGRRAAEEVATTGQAMVDDAKSKTLVGMIDKRLQDQGADINSVNRFIALTELEKEWAQVKDRTYKPYAKALGFAYAREIVNDPEKIALVSQASPEASERALLLHERHDKYRETVERPLEMVNLEKEANERTEKKREVQDKIAATADKEREGYQITDRFNPFAEKVDHAIKQGYLERLEEADKNNLDVVPKKENKHLIELAEEAKSSSITSLESTLKGDGNDQALALPLNSFAAGGHVSRVLASQPEETLKTMYDNTLLLRNEFLKDVHASSDTMKTSIDEIEMGRRALAKVMIQTNVMKDDDIAKDYITLRSDAGKALPEHMKLEPRHYGPKEPHRGAQAVKDLVNAGAEIAGSTINGAVDIWKRAGRDADILG